MTEVRSLEVLILRLAIDANFQTHLGRNFLAVAHLLYGEHLGHFGNPEHSGHIIFAFTIAPLVRFGEQTTPLSRQQRPRKVSGGSLKNDQKLK